MKKFINNKIYDTATAVRIGEKIIKETKETLFRKKTGEFFMHAATRGPFGLEDIFPISDDNARKWAEENLEGWKVDSVFAKKEKQGNKTRISGWVSIAVKEKIELLAKEKITFDDILSAGVTILLAKQKKG